MTNQSAFKETLDVSDNRHANAMILIERDQVLITKE
jgi:hypothetical protein